MVAFTLFSIIILNEPLNQITTIIIGGLALSVLMALIISIWYRSSAIDVTSVNGTSFLLSLRKSVSSFDLELVNETSEVLFIKSNIKNIFYSENYEVVIHIHNNDFQIEGYNFLIKRILKSIPPELVAHLEKHS